MANNVESHCLEIAINLVIKKREEMPNRRVARHRLLERQLSDLSHKSWRWTHPAEFMTAADRTVFESLSRQSVNSYDKEVHVYFYKKQFHI